MEIVIFAENFATDCIFIVIMIDGGGSVCSCGYSFATCDTRYCEIRVQPDVRTTINDEKQAALHEGETGPDGREENRGATREMT